MSGENRNTNEPGLGRTIKEDLYEDSLFKNFYRDIKELKEFYISAEKKKKLETMNPFKRAFFLTVWILKSMILKLTPTRRLLLLIGVILIIISGSFGISLADSDIRVSMSRGLIGGAIVIVVLMLELKDKLLARDELEAGRKVQQALMPEQNPYVEGWSVWLYSRSANEVCGDLVDFLNISEERTGVLMADVAGKGLNAALLTAKLQATIRALAPDHDAVNLVTKVNSIFYRENLRNIFASLLYFDVTKGSNELRLVNAGHYPAYHCRGNQIKEFEKGDIALGLMKNAVYKETVAEVETGDVILAYSDGVTEARNHTGEFYGNIRLSNLLCGISKLPANEIGNGIVKAIDNFIGDVRLHDDLSIIVLKKQ
ncbi:MAG: serine/threonine-protein phosphatase [Bacteroidetes bacterium]|nr:serine/threonine-protein phosphatase [Bacteroidota bacterium]